MIIVSQDKSEVFNFSEIFRLWVDTWSSKEFATEPDCWCIRAEKASDNMICAFLGEYATEERAKEVLQEIIEFLDRKSLVGMDRDGITMQVLGNIYRMPKE